MKQASFYVLAEWRLRRNAIGSFVTQEEAEQYLALMPEPRGWRVVGVEQPVLTVTQLEARLVRSGFYSGTGPFEDEPEVVGDFPELRDAVAERRPLYSFTDPETGEDVTLPHCGTAMVRRAERSRREAGIHTRRCTYKVSGTCTCGVILPPRLDEGFGPQPDTYPCGCPKGEPHLGDCPHRTGEYGQSDPPEPDDDYDPATFEED